MKHVKPITPNEVIEGKKFPPEVIKAFNDLIVKNWNGSFSKILQKDVVALIVRTSEFSSNQIFNNNWLDVEPCFRKAGWKVVYDKPAYCETYEASFEFSRK